MPQGGSLIIETRDDGPHVMLSVTDTGCGMDAETQARVFEPFFTTKELGKGTGLGLSIVYGAVKQSEGRIQIISSPGRGATFQISLPRVDDIVARPEMTAAATSRAAGSETILVVEDDRGVRLLVSTVLRNGGYRVLDACDGDEALRTCGEHAGQIALVLTDVVMPGMRGTRLIDEVKRLNPGIKILCMSGYADHPAIGEGWHDSSIPFLQKPFTTSKLLGTVREVLDLRVARNASRTA